MTVVAVLMASVLPLADSVMEGALRGALIGGICGGIGGALMWVFKKTNPPPPKP